MPSQASLRLPLLYCNSMLSLYVFFALLISVFTSLDTYFLSWLLPVKKKCFFLLRTFFSPLVTQGLLFGKIAISLQWILVSTQKDM